MSGTTRLDPAAATLDEIKALIGLDTTSRNSNLAIIDRVSDRLRNHGIEPVLVSDSTGEKANLIATFPAADGSTDGGMVLSAHTDVVPVDGQDWSSDPFAAEVRDGRLYGRGSSDMKSFLGVVVAKIPAMAAEPLAEPIHLAFSYDEEVGCLGAVGLVDAMTAAGLRPRGCIVGEPSGMRIIRAHKSISLIEVGFHGVAAHSSLTPQGVNAIEYAAEFIRFVRALADGFRDHGPYDDAFDVPFTTATVNLVSGGIAVNTVPADCSVSLEFRSIAAVDPGALIDRLRDEAARIEQAMRRENPAARVEFVVPASVPGLDTPGDAEIIGLVSGWGGTPRPDKVAYGTEAGIFARAGIPTVICGPGDIAHAHAPDEFIELDQIVRCEALIDGVIAHARG